MALRGPRRASYFEGFFSASLNSFDAIAFAARVNADAANDTGIWARVGGDLKLVAREGDRAPGVTGDAVFGDLYSPAPPAFNDLGETAFVAKLRGADVTTANDLGIWATDVSGALRLIVRKGDTIEVGPGDFRTVTSLNNASFGSDPRAPKLNNKGQIAFHAGFSNDGSSGIFISNAVAVPEGATALLAAVGCACFLCRRAATKSECALACAPF